MEIKGKVHCFFEQSGTFKQEFIKLGIPAEDYDIQNNFGQTDHKIDLFAEIEQAYEGGKYLRPYHQRRPDNGLLPVHLLLCAKPDEFHVGLHQLSQYDGQAKDRCDIGARQAPRLFLRACNQDVCRSREPWTSTDNGKSLEREHVFESELHHTACNRGQQSYDAWRLSGKADSLLVRAMRADARQKYSV